MQAEEVQKELEEMKTKNAVAEQTSQSDAVALRERLESTEKERDEITTRLGSADVEKNEALRKVKNLEQCSQELQERLVAVTEVSILYRSNLDDIYNCVIIKAANKIQK